MSSNKKKLNYWNILSCWFDFIYPQFYDRQQVQALIKSIRQRVKKPLLVTVDQEGGRVQRFREGFTQLPAMQLLRH